MAQEIVEHPEAQILDTLGPLYGMTPQAFGQTVFNLCFPPNNKQRSPSREEFAAFLMVCRDLQLNPLIKEIYGLPLKNGTVAPVVPIDGWLRIINRHPQFDGMEFQDHHTGKVLEAVTCRIYRKDRTHPTEVTEYLAECKRDGDVWAKYPHRMLRHKAMIQAARYAFSLGAVYDPDEAERVEEAVTKQIEHEALPPPPPEPPVEALTHEAVEGVGSASSPTSEPAPTHDPEPEPEPEGPTETETLADLDIALAELNDPDEVFAMVATYQGMRAWGQDAENQMEAIVNRHLDRIDEVSGNPPPPPPEEMPDMPDTPDIVPLTPADPGQEYMLVDAYRAGYVSKGAMAKSWQALPQAYQDAWQEGRDDKAGGKPNRHPAS